MTTLLSILLLYMALGLFCILAVIDFKTRLLPNIYTYPLAALALIFHTINDFSTSAPLHVFLGGLCGGGLLYGIRAVANKIYQTDTLGLGDVKLMGAAGLWLGFDHIFLALCLGAVAGVFHGLIAMCVILRKTGKMPDISTLAIPAGPGFIAGILIVGYMKFQFLLHTPPL